MTHKIQMHHVDKNVNYVVTVEKINNVNVGMPYSRGVDLTNLCRHVCQGF